MTWSGHPITDDEYLREKERELAYYVRRVETLRSIIAALRQHLHQEPDHGVSSDTKTPDITARKPRREERVIALLTQGPLSSEELARAFKIRKEEMQTWMNDRLGKGSAWTRSTDGKMYSLLSKRS